MGIKNGAVYISPIVGGMEICDLKLFFKSWKKVRPGFPFWDQNVKELPPCPNFCTFRSKPFVVLRKSHIGKHVQLSVSFNMFYYAFEMWH